MVELRINSERSSGSRLCLFAGVNKVNIAHFNMSLEE